MLPSARWLAGSRTRIIRLLHQPKLSGHSFWHLRVWANITGKIKRSVYVNQHANVFIYLFAVGGGCLSVVGSCLFFWSLVSLQAFALSAKPARLHGWGREKHWTHGFWWEEGALWCSSFMETHSTLWYFIRHLGLFFFFFFFWCKNICAHIISTRLGDLLFLRMQISASHTAASPKVLIFKRPTECASVLFDFLGNINQCLDEH